MNDTPIQISFIIPALNEEKLIGKCLGSIRQAVSYAPEYCAQIIVVDNQSTDKTAEIAKSHSATIVSTAPGCIGRARNEGSKIATGDFLCFIDADCELEENWIGYCFEHFKDTKVFATGCTMSTPLQSATWVETIWYHMAHNSEHEPFTKVQWLSTQNLIVRKDAFEKIGGFDESLTTCEDCDLGYRLSESGQLILDHRVGFLHLGESQSLKQFFKREMWRASSNLQNLRKHKFNPSEWPSLLIPHAYLFGFLFTFIFAIAKVTGLFDLGLIAILSPGVLSLALPLAITFKKTNNKHFKNLSLGYALMSLYLSARAIGTFISAKRVTRD